MGFFDLGDRYAGLDKFGDPLVLLKKTIPWESFRPELKAVWRLPREERKSNAGRKPWDEIVMFKVIVLQQLYNLSDDRIEYQIRDRLSFMRFLDLGVEDRVPDAKTVWLYREKLAKAVKLIRNTQNAQGGWRYQPRRTEADISVTICQVMALRAARRICLFRGLLSTS